LNRFIALTGNYATSFHRSGDRYCVFEECFDFEDHRRLDEFMGGVRFSVPNASRITPYGAVTAGALVLTTRTGTSETAFGRMSNASPHFGVAAGRSRALTRASALFSTPERFLRSPAQLGTYARPQVSTSASEET
jgi:hypothetical protein